MQILTLYFSLGRWKLFLSVTGLNILLSVISRILLVNDIVFYNGFSEQLTYDRAMVLYNSATRLAWLGYVMIPLILAVKFTLVSTALYIGLYFLTAADRISFGDIFRVVTGSEIVFIISGLCKFLWFVLFAGNYDINDLTYFYPLSLINLFDFREIDRIWIYPLQVLNLFQVFYLLLISAGLRLKLRLAGAVAEKAVLLSYLPGLLLIISLVMFLSVGKS